MSLAPRSDMHKKIGDVDDSEDDQGDDDLDVDLNRPTNRDLGLDEDEDPADRRRDPLRMP